MEETQPSLWRSPVREELPRAASVSAPAVVPTVPAVKKPPAVNADNPPPSLTFSEALAAERCLKFASAASRIVIPRVSRVLPSNSSPAVHMPRRSSTTSCVRAKCPEPQYG
jgi:hypothetical protein